MWAGRKRYLVTQAPRQPVVALRGLDGTPKRSYILVVQKVSDDLPMDLEFA
jgi:hypothetical protein